MTSWSSFFEIIDRHFDFLLLIYMILYTIRDKMTYLHFNMIDTLQGFDYKDLSSILHKYSIISSMSSFR